MSLIGRDEALKIAKDNGNDALAIVPVLNALETDKENADLRVREYKDVLDLRLKWSNGILFAVKSIVYFDIALIACIGLGLVHFDNQIVVPVFIADSLLKVLGLALIIVKFLFNQPLSKS